MSGYIVTRRLIGAFEAGNRVWYAAAEREVDLDVRPRHESHSLLAFGSICTVVGALLRRAAATRSGRRRGLARLLSARSDLMAWRRAMAEPYGVLSKDVRCTVDTPTAHRIIALGYAGALTVPSSTEQRARSWPVFFRTPYDPTLADLLVNQLHVLPAFDALNGIDLFHQVPELAPHVDKLVHDVGTHLPRLFWMDPKSDRPNSQRLVLATLDAATARNGEAWCRVGTAASVLVGFADYLAADIAGQGGVRAAIDAMIAFDAALDADLAPATPDLSVDLDFGSALESPAANRIDQSHLLAFWSAFRPAERGAGWHVRTHLRRLLDLGMQHSLVVRQHMQTAA